LLREGEFTHQNWKFWLFTLDVDVSNNGASPKVYLPEIILNKIFVITHSLLFTHVINWRTL